MKWITRDYDNNSFLKGTDVDDCTLPEFKHLLIVFGGVGGIEAALEVIIYLCTLRLIKLRNMKTTIYCKSLGKIFTCVLKLVVFFHIYESHCIRHKTYLN